MGNPKLRFNNCSEEWVPCELGEISDVTKLAGFEFTKYIKYKDTGSIIALRGLNVKEGKLILDDVKYIDGSDFSKLERSKLYKGDLLFTYVGTIGEVAIVDEDDKYYLAPNVCLIRPSTKVNPSYLFTYMQRDLFKEKVIMPLVTTSSQSSLSMANVRKFMIKLPGRNEQDKIAEFYSKVDRRIELQQSKVKALKEQKKGLLQKIFSRELRFKDENGEEYPEWINARLKEISKPVKRTLKDSSRKPPVLTISAGRGFLNQQERFSQVIAGSSLSKYTLLKKGELSYNRGASKLFPYGCIYVQNDYEEALVPNVYRSFKLNRDHIPEFFNQLFSTGYADRQLRRFISSSARLDGLLNVDQEDFYSLIVPVPSLPEQRKISEFLMKLDDYIATENEKLSHLQLQKKGLMQQMFV